MSFDQNRASASSPHQLPSPEAIFPVHGPTKSGQSPPASGTVSPTLLLDGCLGGWSFWCVRVLRPTGQQALPHLRGVVCVLRGAGPVLPRPRARVRHRQASIFGGRNQLHGKGLGLRLLVTDAVLLTNPKVVRSKKVKVRYAREHRPFCGASAMSRKGPNDQAKQPA